MNNKIGNLVYIPSSTNLLQYGKSSPIKVLMIEAPANLLVLEEEGTKLGVLFRGEIWYVDKRRVYDV